MEKGRRMLEVRGKETKRKHRMDAFCDDGRDETRRRDGGQAE